MRREYDFSSMKGRKNPFVKYLKQPVTIRFDKTTVAYFKAMASEYGLPYQQLINLYLRDCVATNRKLKLRWAA
jgi:predicted DNA binding CopG/RHH family protein